MHGDRLRAGREVRSRLRRHARPALPSPTPLTSFPSTYFRRHVLEFPPLLHFACGTTSQSPSRPPSRALFEFSVPRTSSILRRSRVNPLPLARAQSAKAWPSHLCAPRSSDVGERFSHRSAKGELKRLAVRASHLAANRALPSPCRLHPGKHNACICATSWRITESLPLAHSGRVARRAERRAARCFNSRLSAPLRRLSSYGARPEHEGPAFASLRTLRPLPLAPRSLAPPRPRHRHGRRNIRTKAKLLASLIVDPHASKRPLNSAFASANRRYRRPARLRPHRTTPPPSQRTQPAFACRRSRVSRNADLDTQFSPPTCTHLFLQNCSRSVGPAAPTNPHSRDKGHS